MNSNTKKFTNVHLKVMKLPDSFSRLSEVICQELTKRLNTSYFAQLYSAKLQGITDQNTDFMVQRVTDVQLTYKVLEDSGLFGLCILLDKSNIELDLDGSLLLCVSLIKGMEYKLFYLLCYEDLSDGE